MSKLIALYKQPADQAAFDQAYFNTHLPLIAKVPGLQKLGQVIARNQHLRPALRIALARLKKLIPPATVTDFLVPPANLPLPACAFHSITGHSCLTCGMTRSLHAILHGDLAASIRYHLFGPAIFLGMLLCLMSFAAEAISGRRYALRAGGKMWGRAVPMFAVLWFVYWGVRLAAEFAAQ